MNAAGTPADGGAQPLARERGRGQRAGTLPPERLLREIARYADDKKAIDIVELDLRGVLGYTDYFVVCSGNTARQAKAIHDGILEGLKRDHDTLPRRVEGSADTGWILMDYLDVVVHVFTPQTREFYRLERLWGEAPARVRGEDAPAGDRGDGAAEVRGVDAPVADGGDGAAEH
ncbi:MAG TPA: ribosome silencing factor [Solirubrobacteraceae bacterium]|nr:ribosome silencing factor [Solirubrobacteraceae bacterium]